MKIPISGASSTVRVAWDNLSKVPGGNVLFSKGVGQVAPYSGSIGAIIEELGPGTARVSLKDRRKVRNHLRSVHAIALVNLAEIASGLAMMYGIPDDARGILRGFSIEFLKKARGKLIATCAFDAPQTNEKKDYDVEVNIYNEAEEIVAKANALWRIGPMKEEGND